MSERGSLSERVERLERKQELIVEVLITLTKILTKIIAASSCELRALEQEVKDGRD